MQEINRKMVLPVLDNTIYGCKRFVLMLNMFIVINN